MGRLASLCLWSLAVSAALGACGTVTTAPTAPPAASNSTATPTTAATLPPAESLTLQCADFGAGLSQTQAGPVSTTAGFVDSYGVVCSSADKTEVVQDFLIEQQPGTDLHAWAAGAAHGFGGTSAGSVSIGDGGLLQKNVTANGAVLYGVFWTFRSFSVQLVEANTGLSDADTIAEVESFARKQQARVSPGP